MPTPANNTPQNAAQPPTVLYDENGYHSITLAPVPDAPEGYCTGLHVHTPIGTVHLALTATEAHTIAHYLTTTSSTALEAEKEPTP